MKAPLRIAAILDRFAVPASLGIVAAAVAASISFALPAVAFADTTPTVSAETASLVGVTTAKLTGKVNPNGTNGDGNTTWRLQFSPAGTDHGAEGNENWSTGAEAAIEAPASEEANDVEVEALIGFSGELQPGHEYEFRLQAENGGGQGQTASPYPTFTMQPVTAPALTANPATAVERTTAILHAELDPEGGNQNQIASEILPIRWELQYSIAGQGSWAKGGEGMIEGAEATGSTPISLQVSLPSETLVPNTEYETRLVAYYSSPSLQLKAISSAPNPTFKTLTSPPVVTQPGSVPVDDQTVDLGGWVSPRGSVTNCKFLYGPTTAYGQEAACLNHPGNETQVVSVFAAVPSQFRLSFKAQTTPFLSSDASPAEVQTALEALPSIGAGNVSVVGGPHFLSVTFEGAFADTDVPSLSGEFENNSGLIRISADDIRGGLGALTPVRAELVNLAPATVYHMKLVASSDAGSNESEDVTFETFDSSIGGECSNEAQRTEQHTTFLPDCRTYEMVSPPDKNGGDVMIDNGHIRAAADGSALTFVSRSAFGDSIGGNIGFAYMAVRGPEHWQTHAILPPQQQLSPIGTIQAFDSVWEGEFSPDLSTGVLRSWTPIASAAGQDPNVQLAVNLYRRTDLRQPGLGSYELLSSCPGCVSAGPPITNQPLPLTSNSSFLPHFAGASADFHKVLFESIYPLTADAPPGVAKLYEWAEGELRWIGQIPPGSATECGPAPLEACVAAERSVAGQGVGAGGNVGHYVPGVISADGSRIFFTVATSNASERGDLFMRDDKGTEDVSDDTTSKLNAVEDGTGEGPSEAIYSTATHDGSRIFFTTQQQLTAEDTDSGGVDLYMYEADAPIGSRLTLISLPKLPDGRSDGSAEGVIGTSVDGHYVYYLMSARIYLWHDGTLAYVGELQNKVENIRENLLGESFYDVTSRLQSSVTANGRRLLFTSRNGEALLSAHGGSDYNQVNCDLGAEISLGLCPEYYVYDADDNSLRCASCNPDDPPVVRPTNSTIWLQSASGTAKNSHLNRGMSADGRYIFFNTAEPLAERDTNGVIDAYEYDTTTGQARLLSTGTSSADSYFMDASTDGHDVFIATREPLSGWDADDAYDLYDVRINGGLPEPPSQIAPCSADSCRSALPSPPAASPAGSAKLQGSGNPSAVGRCPNGKRKVRKKGKVRCLKRGHRGSHRSHLRTEHNKLGRTGR